MKNHKISGIKDRPRVSVFKSNKYLYAQAIDDLTGKTLVSVNKEKDPKKVGINLAEKLKSAGISAAVFDRKRNRYHGKIKALADSIREGGIKL